MASRLAHRPAISVAAAAFGLVSPAWSGSISAPAAPAQGADAALSLVASCERVTEPGRVRCDVEVLPPPGSTLRWADVVLVEVPAFSTALRGRLTPDEASRRAPSGYRFAFALLARGPGKGTLGVRVRAVVCREDTSCRALTSDSATEVSVGAR